MLKSLSPSNWESFMNSIIGFHKTKACTHYFASLRLVNLHFKTSKLVKKVLISYFLFVRLETKTNCAGCTKEVLRTCAK